MVFSRYMSCSGITGSYGSSIFSLFDFFLATLTACRNSQAKDQTYTKAMTMRDPLLARPPGNSCDVHFSNN